VDQANALQHAFRQRRVTFGGAPMPSFLRPHFVARREFDALRAAGRRLLELSARVARAAFDGDVSRLLAFLGTPEAEAAWVRHDPGRPDVVLSRLDAFQSDSGPRFIEINSDAPAGFGYGDRMASIVMELPVYRAFSSAFRASYVPSAPSVAEAVLRHWRAGGGAGSPRVAIVDWDEVKTRPDQELLAEEFEAQGASCHLGDPRTAEARGGRFFVAGRGADVVYRRAVLSELVAREADVRGFLDAYRAGAALFVNSLRCRISEDKAFFAFLTDEVGQALLTEDERRFVAAVVPWTRRVEERRVEIEGRPVDLVAHVVANRERLVLKPAHGYGGTSVFVGSETSAPAWEKAVAEALRGDGAWVVQERVAIPEEEFPVIERGGLAFHRFKVNVNPFYVEGATVGAVTRASKSAVINVSAGGGSAPTFVLEEG
jgi:hypothetical protein